MTTTLYFVRHGETDHNRLRIVQGRGVDGSLNATGRTQAAALGHRLASVSLDVIYTSTQRRARETTEAIARFHEAVPVIPSENLEEMDWGIFEGRPNSPEMEAVFKENYTRWSKGIFDVPVEGGESILDVQRRAVTALDAMLEQHAGGTLLVVSHGRLLRVLLASVLDGYGLEQMHLIKHANTSVNRVQWYDGRFEVNLLNCTAHLEALEAPEAG